MAKAELIARYGKLISHPYYQYQLQEHMTPKQVHYVLRRYGILQLSPQQVMLVTPSLDRRLRLVASGTTHIGPATHSQHVSKIVRSLCTRQLQEQYRTDDVGTLVDSVTYGTYTIHIYARPQIHAFPDGTFFLHFNYNYKVLQEGITDLDNLQQILAQDPKIRQDKGTRLVSDFATLSLQSVDFDRLPPSSSYALQFSTYFIHKQLPDLRDHIHSMAHDHSALLKRHRILVGHLSHLTGVQWSTATTIASLHTSGGSLLTIGGGKRVRKLSAMYYEGLYHLADRLEIVIWYSDYRLASLASDLFGIHFGSSSKGLVVSLRSLADIDDVDSEDNTGKYALVVTPIHLRENRVRKLYQSFTKVKLVLLDHVDNYALSNAVVSLLSLTRGAVVAKLAKRTSTYCVGIDIGHSHSPSRLAKYSQIGFTLYNAAGLLLLSKVYTGVLREHITSEPVDLFVSACNFAERRVPAGARLVIYRDGKLHKQDSRVLVAAFGNYFLPEQIDILSVAKRDNPRFLNVTESKSPLADAGTYVVFPSKRLAIVQSTDQSKRQGKMNASLKVVHEYGDRDIHTLLQDLLAFTRLYQTNIYYPSFLPLPIWQADRLASTSSSRH